MCHCIQSYFKELCISVAYILCHRFLQSAAQDDFSLKRAQTSKVLQKTLPEIRSIVLK